MGSSVVETYSLRDLRRLYFNKDYIVVVETRSDMQIIDYMPSMKKNADRVVEILRNRTLRRHGLLKFDVVMYPVRTKEI
jgi:hypothetical protein